MTFPFRAVQEEGKRPSAVRESRDVVAWSSESDPVCTALEKANNNNNKKQTKKDFVFFFHRPSRFLAKSGGLPAVTCSSRSYRGANHGHLITPGSAHQSVEGENLDPKNPITLFFNVHHLLWDVPVFFHTKYEKKTFTLKRRGGRVPCSKRAKTCQQEDNEPNLWQQEKKCSCATNES